MRFKTLYADPPWHFNDKLDPTRRKPYDTLSIEDLMKLDINPLMEPNSHFYLWSTSSHIHEALHLMDAWGFKYKTIIPWVKYTKNNKQWFGMGHYFRATHELCLFGVKGKLRTLTKNTRNILHAKAPRRHSAKPEEMYELIEANSPSSYIELFSRNKRVGWTMLGDEFEGEDINDAINRILLVSKVSEVET